MYCFHCSGKNKISIHAQSMKNELCTFGDSIYELNVLASTFKTGIAQCKDEW